MGDENLNSYYRRMYVAFAFFAFIFVISWIFPRNQPEPIPNPAFEKTILIMKASPVDNEPGAYILEYSNGAIEILHFNGSRELLTPQSEENDDDRVQSVRPDSDVN